MKLALAPLALLAALSLAACGSDDADGSDAPDAAAETSTSAGSTAFCDALVATATLQDGKDVAALRDDLESAGLPDEAGEDAQAGLQVYLDLLGQVDEDATAEDLATMEDPKLSKEEQAKVDAMVSYATETCATGAGENSETPESPSASEPAESPSESASE